MMDGKVKYPAPQGNPETKQFWDAAASGRLLIKRCTACGEPHYFPRSICPFCFSDQTVWEESSGEGTVYSFSLMRKSATGPYAIGYVTLKEGPSLLTNFVDCDMDKLKIGQRVKVVFKPTDGAPLPFFTPV
jgi:uncharacterized OB-fold protein